MENLTQRWTQSIFQNQDNFFDFPERAGEPSPRRPNCTPALEGCFCPLCFAGGL